jgi:hypothetical protein
MGCGSSTPAEKIVDKYKTIREVQVAIRKAGLEASQLVFGIDYTKSNTLSVCLLPPFSLHYSFFYPQRSLSSFTLGRKYIRRAFAS